MGLEARQFNRFAPKSFENLADAQAYLDSSPSEEDHMNIAAAQGYIEYNQPPNVKKIQSALMGSYESSARELTEVADRLTPQEFNEAFNPIVQKRLNSVVNSFVRFGREQDEQGFKDLLKIIPEDARRMALDSSRENLKKALTKYISGGNPEMRNLRRLINVLPVENITEALNNEQIENTIVKEINYIAGASKIARTGELFPMHVKKIRGWVEILPESTMDSIFTNAGIKRETFLASLS